MDIIILYFFIRLFNRIIQPSNCVRLSGWKIKHGGTVKDASRHFDYVYLGNGVFLKINKLKKK